MTESTYVYIVYEFCGGHETEVDKVFATESKAKEYCDENGNFYHYEKTEVL